MESFLRLKFVKRGTFTSNSAKDTIAAAKEFAKKLKPGDVVALSGDLGAGKTHFVKGAAKAFGIVPKEVVSPTFGILKRYISKAKILYHFDFYRLKDLTELEKTGYRECIINEDAFIFIEWPEIIPETWRDFTHVVSIKHKGADSRGIVFYEKKNIGENRAVKKSVTHGRTKRVKHKKDIK
jgi:tRNA threonylcarbamoyladenosine biosynthesis protein TsaE